MANPILLPQNFASYDFVMMSRKEPNPKNRIRLIAMANIKDGKPLTVVADSIKVHWKTVQSWLSNFRNNGIQGLYVKTRKLKQRKLDETVEKWISEFINALNAKDTGGYITGKQLHILVEKEFSTNCCLRTIYNTLHHLNYSWISSRSKHPKSDEEVQRLYKKLSSTLGSINSASH